MGNTKKKMMTAAIAGSLAAAMVVGGGTFAYLSQQTDQVTNEFKPNHALVEINETENDYEIIPGTEQTKDPSLTPDVTLASYLYAIVTDETQGLVSYTVADGWKKLDDLSDETKSVYYRKVTEADNGTAINILKDNKVSYDAGITNDDMKDDAKLKFRGFVIQAEPFKTGENTDDEAALAAYNQTAPADTQQGLNEKLAAADNGDVVDVAPGTYELPNTVPEGVTIDGTNGTVFDTVNISGSNRGTLKDDTFKGVSFITTTDYRQAAPGGGQYAPSWQGIFSHNTTLTDTTFKDCTFDADACNHDNAIYGGTVNGDVTFENCTISADVYGANFSYVNGTLTFKNCDITGWNSFGGGKNGADSKVVFENCRFHKSGSYGTLRFYQDAEVKNCTFDDDFEWIDCNASGKTITITNCTGIDASKIFNNGSKTSTWIVDGTQLENVPSH